MNYNELENCLIVAEHFFSAFKVEKSETKVSLSYFQEGANGPVKQKLRLATSYHNADIAFEVMPKRSEPDA